MAPTVPVQNQCFQDSSELSFSHSPKTGKTKDENRTRKWEETSNHVMGDALVLTRDPPTCYSTLGRDQLLLKVQARGAGGGVRRVGVGGQEVEIRGSADGPSCVADSPIWD